MLIRSDFIAPVSKRSQALIRLDLWPSITKATRQAGPCHVAVAYVGKSAPKLLPLKKGSVLVCDFSRSSLERGLIHPDAIRAYLEAGVEVHSWENLHAKVFCFGEEAFVGSCNASAHSAQVLTEAAMRVTDPTMVREIRNFVIGLRGARIGPLHLEQMAAYYCPPEWEKKSAGVPFDRISFRTNRVPLWLVDLPKDASEEAEKQANAGAAKARRLISDPSGFELDWFEWNSKKGVPRPIRENGGEIVRVERTGKRAIIYAPARFLEQKPIGDTSGYLIRIEAPIDAKPLPLSRAVRKLGAQWGDPLANIKVSRLIGHSDFANNLRQLW